MKTLLLLRHAKSSWGNAHLADHERPLNDRGRRDAPRMGRLLRQKGLTPDLIISSTARRALQTAKAAAEACGYEGELQTSGDLYHSDPEEIAAVLRGVPNQVERVMIVAHNPGISEMVDWVTGFPESLPTAALVELRLDVASWANLTEDIEGQLMNLWLPRHLSD